MVPPKANASEEAEQFYRGALVDLTESGIPFMLAGTYALTEYTGIIRPTKDLDVFCKAGDYPRILHFLKERDYNIEVTDERWLVKVFQKHSGLKSLFNKTHFVDVIFGTKTGLCQVDDTWFERAPTVEVLGVTVKIVPPEEFIWSKSFRQEREKYDGADVHHMFLRKGRELDWKRLLTRMEQYWEILFAHIVTFRFVYPTDREVIPRWVMEDLMGRLKNQMDLPPPKDRVCRGRILSRAQYEYAIREWDYLDFI